jgi:hypothetical protein
MVGGTGSACPLASMGAAQGPEAGTLPRARVPPVTSASSIRPVDSTSLGVIVFPRYSPLFRSGYPSLAPAPAPRSIRMEPLPQHTLRIDPASWPIIAERAQQGNLRDLAAEYGVSHETIRKITQCAPGAPT